MNREITLTHEFVEYIPNELKDGTIYVSIPFATVTHKCCCGCGNEVVTPLSPTDWKLIFDGRSISLDPSIGNWSFSCQSHYWIKRNTVKWARPWSRKQIQAGRMWDALTKKRYFGSVDSSIAGHTVPRTEPTEEAKSKDRLWSKVKSWFTRGANSF